MFERNDVDHDDLISILFTATDDIHSAFPATGRPQVRPRRRAAALRPRARHRGRHAPVHPGADPPAAPTRPAAELHHVYLEGAREPPRRPPGLMRRIEPRPCPSRRRGPSSSAPASSAARSAWPCARSGWHVTGRDRDPAGPTQALALGALDAVGDDPAADVTFVATPVRRRRRRGPARPGRDGRRRHRRRQREGADRRRRGRPPLRRRPPDGRLRAGGRRRRRRRRCSRARPGCSRPTDGTDADAYAAVAPVVSSLGAEVVALPPERHDALVAVVSHVPHLTAATLMRLAAERGRGAPGAAAPGRRRLPRHDPHRRRPPRHLARHLRREPRRHRRRARPPASAALARHARRRGRRATAPACSPRSSGPARPGSTCRPACAPAADLRRGARPGARPPRRAGRGHHPGRRARRQHRRPRDRPLGRGRPRACSILLVEAGAGRACSAPALLARGLPAVGPPGRRR